MKSCSRKDGGEDRGCSRRDHIAHRLVRVIGDPERRQLAGPMQFRRHRRIAAIRLDAVARLDRHQRWRHNNAYVPRAGQQPVQPGVAGAGLVAEAEPAAALVSPGEPSSCPGSPGGSRTRRSFEPRRRARSRPLQHAPSPCISSPTKLISSIRPGLHTSGSVPVIRHNPLHGALRDRTADHAAGIGSSDRTRRQHERHIVQQGLR